VGLSVLFVLAWSVYRRRRITWPTDREQVRWIALASLFSFSPIAIWLIISSLGITLGFEPTLLFPLVIFPLAAGYAVQRYRMRQADLVLSVGYSMGFYPLYWRLAMPWLQPALDWVSEHHLARQPAIYWVYFLCPGPGARPTPAADTADH